MELHLQTHC